MSKEQTIVLYLDTPIGMRCHDGDGNVWSTISSRNTTPFECMECGESIARAYFTQRDGTRRYLCTDHVTLDISKAVSR